MKLNKQEKIRKLTWKYFWMRKTWELMGCLEFILIPYWIGKLSGDWINIYDEVMSVFNYWVEGFFILIGIIIAGFIIYKIIQVNWEKAEEKAEEEIK